jgi:ubiquinone/menaquinone biosynthesis C-methylase UbiE
VATLVLCTAAEPERVIAELYRVLRPGGQYLFLEHVISPDPKIRRLQNFIQPLWYYFANGCRCNQDTGTMIKNSSFTLKEFSFHLMPKFPKVVTPMITGVAIKIAPF